MKASGLEVQGEVQYSAAAAVLLKSPACAFEASCHMAATISISAERSPPLWARSSQAKHAHSYLELYDLCHGTSSLPVPSRARADAGRYSTIIGKLIRHGGDQVNIRIEEHMM